MATTAKTTSSNLGGGAERPRRTKRDARGPHPAPTTALDGWDRTLMLPRLIPVGPEELADDGRDGRRAILRRLAAALRSERMRGRAGHWSYSLDRHIGLVQALAAEQRLMAGSGSTATITRSQSADGAEVLEKRPPRTGCPRRS